MNGDLGDINDNNHVLIFRPIFIDIVVVSAMNKGKRSKKEKKESK